MYSFHVSKLPEFWKNESKLKYIAEPYVADYYNLSNSDEVVIADFTRMNKEDYCNDNLYVSDKVAEYRKEIIYSLNKLHGEDYKSDFWVKALGMGFVRFVHMIYDGYKTASLYNPEEHRIELLDKECYKYFDDFEEFRSLFQNSDFGFEQMFSLYTSVFYEEIYNSHKIKVSYIEKLQNHIISKGQYVSRIKNITFMKIFTKFLFKINLNKRITVGVFNSFFSTDNIFKLIWKSRGKISFVSYNYNYKARVKKDMDMREEISKNIVIKDRFDVFFIHAFNHFFPTLYIENFKMTFAFHQNEVLKYPNLKYLISEAWIGNSRMSFFIATLQTTGVTHIYNEHNYLEHFLEGNHIEQLSSMCDVYYSLGWHDKKYINLYKGASLFPFSTNENIRKKDFTYLYIASLPIVKMAEINCAYGEQEENSIRYINYIKTFFDSLKLKILNKMVYRGYPNKNQLWLQYNSEKKLEKYYNDFFFIDDFSKSSKEMMCSSRLIIIDYLSTAYLEALIMNIPTIILFDPSRYYLEDGYKDFFCKLEEVGIVQINPKEAAIFINKMGENIEQWWESKEVQDARKSFLETNIGKPEDAINFYLSLLKK
jgi:putative transferase (TIGR04331 family)